MASQETITISSGEEDNGFEIVQVTKGRNHNRQKISDGTLTQAESENKDKRSKDAAIAVSAFPTIAQVPTRARSADIPTSSFETSGLPGRPTSVPLNYKHATHVPTSLQHGPLDRSFLSPDVRSSTPTRRYSSHLSSPGISNPQQPYPTPTTISPSFRRCHIQDLTSNSNSFVAPVNGELALGAREKDLASAERNRQPTPEVVRAAGLEDPFNLVTRKRISNSEVGKTYQTGGKNSKSTKEAPSFAFEVTVKSLPQTTLTSSVQSVEGAGDNLNTNQAAEKASSESNLNDRSKKRQFHTAFSEPTMPQPRTRNRILWSTPAYQERNNEHSRTPPLKPTTELAETRDSPTKSASTVCQQPGTQVSRRAWTCKMYADLAQQLQKSFSFADFAQKHSRSEHEVFDLFSAVVHLPLLQKSSTGLSRVSPQGHQSVKAYRSLMKETKDALAKEGKREGKQPKKSTASINLSAENHVSRKGVAEMGSK